MWILDNRIDQVGQHRIVFGISYSVDDDEVASHCSQDSVSLVGDADNPEAADNTVFFYVEELPLSSELPEYHKQIASDDDCEVSEGVVYSNRLFSLCSYCNFLTG